MKKILLSLAVLATGAAAQAQEQTFGFNQGDILLEGSLQANTQDAKGMSIKNSTFNFTPKAGYFVTDKFAVGLGLNIGSAKEENYSDVTENTFIEKENTVGFEVFGRYYIADLKRFQPYRSEEHTSELQSRENLVCRLLLEKKKNKTTYEGKRKRSA